MRKLLPLILLVPGAVQAWEFTPGLPCRLTHEIPQAFIELTYDPTQPQYTISFTRKSAWPDNSLFEMHFDGPFARSIATDRHTLDKGGARLTVTDTGFGNVLNGLQFSHTARAIIGDISLEIALAGAADLVDAFRRCEVTAGA